MQEGMGKWWRGIFCSVFGGRFVRICVRFLGVDVFGFWVVEMCGKLIACGKDWVKNV